MKYESCFGFFGSLNLRKFYHAFKFCILLLPLQESLLMCLQESLNFARQGDSLGEQKRAQSK